MKKVLGTVVRGIGLAFVFLIALLRELVKKSH